MNLQDKATKLNKLRKAVKRAECKLIAGIAELYPVGSPISWSKGGYVQHGIIIENNPYHTDIRVRNEKTNKVVDITPLDICLAELGSDGYV